MRASCLLCGLDCCGGGPSLTVFLLADAAERTNAEQQLAHAAEVDFVCVPPSLWLPRPVALWLRRNSSPSDPRTNIVTYPRLPTSSL